MPETDGHDPPGILRVIDNSIAPALTIDSGDVVVFDCPGLPLPPAATVAEFEASADLDKPLALVGPVAVERARPGDTLVIEILDVELPRTYGHTVLIPGEGLLGAEVEEAYVHNFTWERGATAAELRPGVSVPIDPFCGTLGVMPAEPGEHPTMPPRVTGGNMDNRHLVAGATLMLPVEVPGALFFAGDGHAAQGDGEVCVSGLETAVRATVRLTVDRHRRVAGPCFLTRPPDQGSVRGKGSFGTSAVGPDLMECSRNAVRHMVEYLVDQRDLPWNQALVLCSLAADLRITEIVDRPNWIVSAHLPLDVFEDSAQVR